MPKSHRILVACHQIVLTGGLMRFERFGRAIRALGHTMSYLTFAEDDDRAWNSEFPVLTPPAAAREMWDAVFVPGAGFPESTIAKFASFSEPNYGLRVQHVLNDQSLRDAFLKVNRIFSPHLVMFNNSHWTPQSYSDFSADRCEILVGAVDTEMFHPAFHRHDSSNGGWTIGGLASKNPEPLIEAVRNLPENVRLKLYGRNMTELDKRHDDLIRSGKLTLTGPLFEEDLAQFYRSLDCVVMTEERAGWANLVAEAMASGIPVVCTRHGTLDMAVDGETAVVVDAPLPELIGKAVTQLMGNTTLTDIIARNAREKVQTMNWTNYSRRLLNLCQLPTR